MKKVLFVLFTLMLVFIAGCKDEVNNNQDKHSELSKDQDSTYAFTGLPADGPTNNRMVAVMVNNHAKARPQTGLSQADIVFELLAEGNITRFLALYQSELPSVIGPVRSAREYYFDLAHAYDAIYVYHGAADFIDQMIQDKGIDHLNGSLYDNDGILFKRESFRKPPHNSYLQLNALYDKAEEKGYDVTAAYEALPFAEAGSEVTGTPATLAKVGYSNNPSEVVQYTFRQDSGSYIRSNGQQQTIDMETEEPIEVSNVLIMEAHHEVIDQSGRRAIDLDSGGKAYLLQKGVLQEVEWKRQAGRIIPVKNGKEVPFVPGKTWINVIPKQPGLQEIVTISSE
ncbi:DUF3048 domain-containing protein [Virgibacillus pantothenticus]|uniref:DUF3048 domain-containing protein n=1 Tax=Virgibacillus pantothenticus TaxID=1473 RepID=UPI0025AFDD73|nr:DUF3048 domain-containing protein [Virgibacillus pantothenticus]